MKQYVITHLQYRALREEIMRGLDPDSEVDAGRCLDILNVLPELPAPSVNGHEINIPEFSKRLAYLMHMKLAEACLDGDEAVQKTMPVWMERQVRIVLGLECWDKCKAHEHVYAPAPVETVKVLCGCGDIYTYPVHDGIVDVGADNQMSCINCAMTNQAGVLAPAEPETCDSNAITCSSCDGTGIEQSCKDTVPNYPCCSCEGRGLTSFRPIKPGRE